MRSIFGKLLLSALVFLLLVGGLEGGLRVAGFENPPPPPIVVWTEWQDKVLDGERGLHVADRDCLWVPRPNNPIRRPPVGIQGSKETVNPRGFRGPELPLERTEGVLRIATMGDSSTFGYGVRWEDTYSAQLVSELARHGVQAEVLCAGTVGHSVVQGLERYRHHVRPYKPDVVVAAYGAVNDGFPVDRSDSDKIAIRREMGGERYRWWRERSRIVQFAASLRASSRSGNTAAPGEPVARVSLDRFETALAELAQLVEGDGAQLVVVSMPRKPHAEERRPHLPPYTERLHELAEREAWPVVDIYASFRAEGDLETWMIDGFHPAPPGHAHIAERLTQAILAERDSAEPGGR